MKKILLGLGVALSLMVGCNSIERLSGADGAVPPDARDVSVDAAADAGTGVTGTATTFYITETATPVPTDLSATEVEVLIEREDGGFNIFPGAGTADGTFSVPDVPEAPQYYIRVGDRYWITSERTLAIESAVPGRTDQVLATTDNTNIVFNVSGLEPWQQGDALTLFSINGGGQVYCGECLIGSQIAPNATTLSATLNYHAVAWPVLLSSSKGDDILLMQLSGESGSFGPYTRLSRIARFEGVEMTDGQTVTMSGAFEVVDPVTAPPIDFRPSEFTSLLNQMALPGGAFPGVTSLGLWVAPAGKEYPQNELELFRYGGSDNVDQILTPVYGNPFPATWPIRLYANNALQQQIEVTPGVMVPRLAFVFVGIMLDDVEGPIEPTLGPITSVTIDGLALDQKQTGVGLRPVITWDAKPGADSYVVSVRRVDENGGRTIVATFSADEPRVRVPPGVLTEGEWHYLRVNVSKDYPGERVSYDTHVFMP